MENVQTVVSLNHFVDDFDVPWEVHPGILCLPF